MHGRRRKAAIETPPKQFPSVINPHAYDESGLNTCLSCGQKYDHRLHIRPHRFVTNYSSKLKRCMCGYNRDHRIHLKG